MLQFNSPILVVDDNEWMASLVGQHLRSLGYTNIITCLSGQQAVDSLHLVPKLVILDYSMPGLTGLETLKWLQAQAPNLPVIFLSAQESMDISLDSLRYGAFDYVIKNDNCLEQITRVIKRVATLEKTAKKHFSHEKKKEIVKNLLILGTIALLLSNELGWLSF
ncbi:MAG: response regulator [Flexibacteraceae bacterium]